MVIILDKLEIEEIIQNYVYEESLVHKRDSYDVTLTVQTGVIKAVVHKPNEFSVPVSQE